jgi:hypothetical protein
VAHTFQLPAVHLGITQSCNTSHTFTRIVHVNYTVIYWTPKPDILTGKSGHFWPYKGDQQEILSRLTSVLSAHLREITEPIDQSTSEMMCSWPRCCILWSAPETSFIEKWRNAVKVGQKISIYDWVSCLSIMFTEQHVRILEFTQKNLSSCRHVVYRQVQYYAYKIKILFKADGLIREGWLLRCKLSLTQSVMTDDVRWLSHR